MPRAQPRAQPQAHVTECLRIAIEVELNRFLLSDDVEMSFPSTLTNHDRRFIHDYVRRKGLTSKSHGKGENVFLTENFITIPFVFLTQERVF